MSSNGNNKKDNKAAANGNGKKSCWYDMSNLTDLWNKHATKVVLVVLLLILVVWYRKEVTDTLTSATNATVSAVGTGVNAVTDTIGLTSSEAAPVAGPAPSGAVLSAQVRPGELAGNVPTASEIRSLFNF